MNIILLRYYDFAANVGHSALCPSRSTFLLSAMPREIAKQRFKNEPISLGSSAVSLQPFPCDL